MLMTSPRSFLLDLDENPCIDSFSLSLTFLSCDSSRLTAFCASSTTACFAWTHCLMHTVSCTSLVMCQVRFHPSRGSVFITGACDGLVNVFDLHASGDGDAPDPYDCLVQTLNTDSSVVSPLPVQSNLRCVYSTTFW
jgi:hypothetical protein